jgi:riboflavin biosynthesis pyrimidine reductase
VHLLVPGDPVDDPLAPYADVDRSAPGRCWVMANMVGGLDGSAAIGGRVGALSGGVDADLFRRIRMLADVVLVGAETVRRERYGPVRVPDEVRAARRRQGRAAVPRLAVVTRSVDLDWTIPGLAGAVEGEGDGPRPLVVTTTDADHRRVAEARQHADVVEVGGGRVDIAAALTALARFGHRVVLCEGGPHLLGQLVAAGLLDELCLTVAPVMGGDALPISVSPAGAPLTGFRLAHVATAHDALFLRYERADYEP